MLFFKNFKAFQRIKGIQTGREQETEATFALFLIRGEISLADNNKILRKGSESVAVWPYILVQLWENENISHESTHTHL